jgi:hypothetical protein
MLAHNVYFTLHDNSEAARDALVAACKKYLKNHPGILFFAAGTLHPELQRPVNDRAYDVSLHVVFDSLASHDAYQHAPLHDRFIEESRPNWKQVRVFDSEVSSG